MDISMQSWAHRKKLLCTQLELASYVWRQQGLGCFAGWEGWLHRLHVLGLPSLRLCEQL